MNKIAVTGGTGYLASIIKNQNNSKKNKYFFFSRNKKKVKNSKLFFINSDLSNLKKYDFILHLAGPSQIQLKKDAALIKKKNKITLKICDLCIKYNIKLIYISSLQVYKNYGYSDITLSSENNFKNLYSQSHYQSEQIIKKKFLNRQNMYTILRVGNVFGFNKYENLNEIKNNIIHSFCKSAKIDNSITVENGHIQRSFVPSRIFLKVINSVIQKRFFNNLIVNICYKNLNLKNVAQIIKKRLKLKFNKNITVIIKNFKKNKKFKISKNKFFKYQVDIKKIYFEIDQILREI